MVYDTQVLNRIMHEIKKMLRKIQDGFRRNGSAMSQILTINRIIVEVHAAQHRAVRIKGKVEQSRERSSVLPYTLVGVVANEKGAYDSPPRLTTVSNISSLQFLLGIRFHIQRKDGPRTLPKEAVIANMMLDENTKRSFT